MTKEQHTNPIDEELVLEFEKAKDMTIGEAVRAHEDLKAGISAEDGLLDRYIKQHRTDIEADKFETLHHPFDSEKEETLSFPLDGELEELGIHKVVHPPQGPFEAFPLSEETLVDTEPVIEHEKQELDRLAPLDDLEELEDLDDIVETDGRRKAILWSIFVLFLIGLTTVFFIWTTSNQTTDTSTSSSTTSTSTTSSSINQADAALAAFDSLYKTFFTDASLTKLKNSEFGKLAALKLALDKIDSSSSAYADAKTKYDNLEKAIAAVQALNGQFSKDIIVDGELDTTATVNAGVTLSAAATGISSVDATLASAVNFGRSQQETGSATVATPPASSASTVVETTPSTQGTTSLTSATAITSAVIGGVANAPAIYGIAIPTGVSLQRDLSRVPYDQSKIDDSTNDAWNFNEGILENIVSISQARGYITGNQYILERVTIINGNGYYNMFKPDGTYLFSINAKTGYFVGNGSGHSDALDY